ncbi:MAG: PaaI family thioesterase [Anaerovoracaceae bacterium]|nr:PaaI family thioesterase [Anaerovoracaceae bacterium]
MIKSKELMREVLEHAYHPDSDVMKDTLNGKLEGYVVDCSLEDMSSVIEYPTLEWELNQAGQVQGGILCCMFDVAAGSLTGTVNELYFNPTVSLNVRFIRPAVHEDTVVIRTKIDNNGKTLVHMSAGAYSKKTGKILATCQSTFFNADNTDITKKAER